MLDHDVILRPLVTEKSTRQMEESNVYTFIVDERANKIQIKGAVERLWDVDVLDVRTMRYAGKARRAFLGRMSGNWRDIGRRPSFKKAMVTLAEGHHIEFYEVG
ncbi:MAG TPA: 50S ribosomal protein L23 [Longimicrobiales bacterium]|jgi:large subunit ribosomal protein L23|nr:50S ribosomal protein L23 [Longimicrobiales bacterium]